MVWNAASKWARRSERGWPEGQAEARRALELDDTSAMAHFALATLLTLRTGTSPQPGASGRARSNWIRRPRLPRELLSLPHDGWRRDDAMTQIEPR